MHVALRILNVSDMCVSTLCANNPAPFAKSDDMDYVATYIHTYVHTYILAFIINFILVQ